MAKKGDVQMRSEYLNFLRFSVTQSAAATFTQTELDTNLSAERGVMMEIHSFEVDFGNNGFSLLREVAASGIEELLIQLTRDSKAAIVATNDSDFLAGVKKQITRSAAIGTDAGPLTVYDSQIYTVNFPLPLPYVKPSIFIGLNSTASSAAIITGRIGYTLREIEREDFLELLVALQ